MPQERTITLNGEDWQFGEIKAGHIMANLLDEITFVNFHPAKVPGGVALDLLRNNLIPDPFYGKNAQQCQWLKDSAWWYKKTFRLPSPASRLFLRFRGVDYESDIFLNGAELGRHTGMFSEQLYEITHLAQKENELLVRLDRLSRYARREQTVRAQFSYGWDFAPRILNPALWDDVELVTCQKVLIENVRVKAENGRRKAGVKNNSSEVHFILTLNSSENLAARLKIKISAANFKETPQEFERTLEIQKGTQPYHIILTMENAKEWNPWDRGFPHVYAAEISLYDTNNLLDSVTEKFGFCAIALEKHAQDKTTSPGWIFVINGTREFLRGVNWVPSDTFYGRLDREIYRKHITLAKEAGINCIRLWGGGLKEKKAFYDICDEEGMLVWQEFPFACIMTSSAPKDEAFLRLTEQEARAIVRELRNHPSTIMYCGGNEFSFKRNQHIIKLLERVAREEDGTRPFNPVSPVHGESHNYTVWHGFAPITEYEKDNSPFPSEFGVQSAPSVETLMKIIPEDKLFPVKPNMFYKLFDFGLAYPFRLEEWLGKIPKSRADENATYWGYHNAQILKHFHYLPIFHRNLNGLSLEEFVALTQKHQCVALQFAIEHYRRGKYYTGGVMFWQWDEPWPCICWSVVDYYLNPKPAYDILKSTLYAPLLVSMKWKRKKIKNREHLVITPYIINDSLNAYENCIMRIGLKNAEGNEMALETITTNIAADSIRNFAPLSVPYEKDKPALFAKLLHNNTTIAENCYDTSIPIHTPKQPPHIKWLYALATKLMME